MKFNSRATFNGLNYTVCKQIKLTLDDNRKLQYDD